MSIGLPMTSATATPAITTSTDADSDGTHSVTFSVLKSRRRR